MQQYRIMFAGGVVSQLGARCVCCLGDTKGAMTARDPSTQFTPARPVVVPVCFACTEHVFPSPIVAKIQVLGLLVGIAFAVSAIYCLQQFPNESFPRTLLTIGGVFGVPSALWLAETLRRRRNLRRDGHHPGLVLMATPLGVLLGTTNLALTEEVLAHNPNARPAKGSRPQPGGLPQAQVVTTPLRQPDDQVRVDVRRDE